MKEFLRRHPLVLPVLMLLLASMFGVVLLAARIALSRRLHHLYLPWNLFLAWVPLGLALVVRHLEARRRRDRLVSPRSQGPTILLAVGWLLFLPNAPYILTDLVHLPDPEYRHYFADMMLILHFALVGLIVGVLSLHVMHTVVENRHGWIWGWVFTIGVAGLTGLGVYIGRVLRWNSWDALVRPWALTVNLGRWGLGLLDRPSELVLPALFGSTLLLAYVLFASLLRPSSAADSSF